MIAVSDKSPLSFNEFIGWYPENSERRYELRRGVITEIFTVCTLLDGEYEMQPFRGNDRILSSNFPELQLTVNHAFNPGV
ncbi:MAG: hypothetical protein O2890_02570 [Cyanobacteria bacterium]|nr:hypothetical protein [Cyanobacteriota bacterium]MDA0865299.1 hypothetical protein [Cyanobacteriota bacterium]